MDLSAGQRAAVSWVQDDVLPPVLGQMFVADELDELTVQWTNNGESLWVTFVARGEQIRIPICTHYPPGDWHRAEVTESDRQVRERVASMLQDEIAQSRFAWGQMRSYTDPGRH